MCGGGGASLACSVVLLYCRRRCSAKGSCRLMEEGGKQQTEQRVWSADVAGEDCVLREVVEERNKLSRENKRLRHELKGLDKVRDIS